MTDKQIHPNIIRQGAFLAVLIFMGITLFKEMYFLLSSFLGALTLYVIMRGVAKKLIEKWKWKKPLAALFLMIISIVLLVLPFAWTTSFAIDKILPFVHDTSKLNEIFEKINQFIMSKTQIDIMDALDMNMVYSKGIGFVQSTIQGTMSGIGSFFFMYLILYFLLTQYKELEEWVKKHLPFKASNDQKVVTEVKSMVYSNAIGIPIVAIVQGIVGTFGYWIFGAEQILLLGLLTAICSVVPMVGAMLVYLPLGLYELSIGHTWQGIAILIWGFGVIGSVDNIARIFLQKQFSDIHPLITLFGVFVGINMFGLMGIIFGPLLLSMFILLIKIYVDEFGKMDNLEG
ncbi:MAG: AI-2E family transporter [Chitinophagales bacterium]|nr:AI-2E family transporter [Chitinophagales bacterium]